MFSSTFSWECHGHLWGDCEKTFPSGTHIHRLHTGETWCLSVAPSSNECLVMTQPPKYLNLTTSMHLCHAARSRTMLSRPFFGYSVQTSELAPVEKWHFQYPPSSNVSSRNDLPQNHRPVCRCHPHRHRNLWAGWSYRSPEHGEADSIDNTAHTPMSADSEEEWDCSSSVFSCPIVAVWMGDPLHNCQNIQSHHLSQRELSNAAPGDCGEPYWRHIPHLGWMGGGWSDRPHGTAGPYNDLASV